MNRSVLAGLVVLVVIAGVSGPVAATPGGLSSGEGTTTDRPPFVSQADSAPALSSQDFDTTTFDITVYENGTAEWTFRYERPLENSTEEDEFETFAEEFEAEETDFYVSFTEQAKALAGAGADETDREMEATGFERSAGIEHRLDPVGVVEMSFTWTGFAEARDDGTVVVGDVFSGSPLYVSSDQRLVLRPGGSLAFSDVQPEAKYTAQSVENATSVTWEGEREFLDGQPRVVFDDLSEQPADDEESTDDEDNTSPEPETGPSTETGPDSWLLVGGLVAVAAGLGGAFVWFHSRGDGQHDDGPPPQSPSEAVDQPAADPSPISEEELLTDEDRVVELIRENGGRMKQVDIVDYTGWSKSKVSMLLSDMEDDGTISKLRVGRENIISLEGFEPEATKSPFDE